MRPINMIFFYIFKYTLLYYMEVTCTICIGGGFILLQYILYPKGEIYPSLMLMIFYKKITYKTQQYNSIWYRYYNENTFCLLYLLCLYIE